MKNNILQNDINEILESIDVEQCRNKTFLISGATGAIARYFVYVLMELRRRYGDDFCTVLILCRNRNKAELIFKNYLGKQGFLILLQQVEMPVCYPGRVDFIIHAAGNSATNLFSKYPVETASANIVGGYKLLELAREKSVEGFLYFSSGAVYGDTDTAVKDITEEEYFTINPFDQNSCYSLSKKMTECLCMSYYREYHVPIKIVRICHTYGPGMDIYDGHVYSDFVKNILKRKDLEIRGDGQDKRAFCYVTDAVIAFFKVLFLGGSGQVYNVANNKEYFSIKELADILCKDVAGNRHLRVSVKNPISQVRQQYTIDTKKLQDLGWTPRVSVREGFLKTLEYFEEKN